MHGRRDEGSHGPHIDVREHSFLDNPRAKELLASVLTVHTCAAGDDGCADGGGEAAVEDGRLVRLRPRLSATKIAAALKGKASEFAVIRFEDPVALFGGFEDEEAAKRFKRRMDEAASIWCCVDAHPGHVWYDMYWDQGPHKDRHNRDIGAEWQPLTGP
jgi:hypothetical protein